MVTLLLGLYGESILCGRAFIKMNPYPQPEVAEFKFLTLQATPLFCVRGRLALKSASNTVVEICKNWD